MKRLDLASALFFAVVAAAFVAATLSHGLWARGGVPGRGGFPFLVALILLGLCVAQAVIALRHERGEASGLSEPGSWRRLGVTLAALVAYALVLPRAGFALTTFVFLVVLVRFIEPQTWLKSLVFAAVTAVVAHVLFRALAVELP